MLERHLTAKCVWRTKFKQRRTAAWCESYACGDWVQGPTSAVLAESLSCLLHGCSRYVGGTIFGSNRSNSASTLTFAQANFSDSSSISVGYGGTKRVRLSFTNCKIQRT